MSCIPTISEADSTSSIALEPATLTTFESEFRRFYDLIMKTCQKRTETIHQAKRAIRADNHQRYILLQWKINLLGELLRLYEPASGHLAREIRRMRRRQNV